MCWILGILDGDGVVSGVGVGVVARLVKVVFDGVINLMGVVNVSPMSMFLVGAGGVGVARLIEGVSVGVARLVGIASSVGLGRCTERCCCSPAGCSSRLLFFSCLCSV